MYIEREIAEKFEKASVVSNIVAVVGARQAGKTTFLKEHMKRLNASYVLFDDPDARRLFEEDIKKFEKQYVEGYEVAVLDEVQYCKDAGRNLKYLADKGKKLWITSSSEIILNKEVLSYLVGRVSVIKLFPFSLTEFLALKKQKIVDAKILQRSIWEHEVYGGYPKISLSEDIETKKMMLKDLYDTMILKDVARAFSIDDIRSLENVVKYMALNAGSIISYETVLKDMQISFQTLKKYLAAMEKSYIITLVQPFYTNKIKEIVKQPKAYFIDTGLRNAAANTFPQEADGKLFENYVLSELIKLGFSPKYWRTKSKAEVDFVIEKDSSVIPIEVKLNSEIGKVERSLRAFIEAYNPKKALIVSYKGEKGEYKIGNCDVVYTNALEMKSQLKS